jgi:alpha-1,2-mannosyltransferase
MTWVSGRLRATHLLFVIGAAVIGVVVAIHVVIITHRRAMHSGDFDISREFGRRFLAHEELYAGGLHYPYMPAAAMYFAPLAVVPAWLGFAVRYALALVCVALTLRMLARLQPWRPQRATRGTTVAAAAGAATTASAAATVAAATLVLSAHYVVRDLDDSGPHLILLALVIVGLLCARDDRLLLAGACIGLATALKAPHGLLLAFFVWTRQHRLAFWTAAATALWILAPALWMGPERWWRSQSQWVATATASLAADPIAGAAESERRVQNQSLTATAGRAARRWLPGASGRSAALVAGLALLATVAWRTRRTDRRAPSWLPHASAVLIAALLLSPATWTQHLVLMLPALYYIVARQWGGTTPPQPLVTVGVALYVVLALALNREILGRERYLILLDHGLHTLAMFVVLVLVLRRDESSAV